MQNKSFVVYLSILHMIGNYKKCSECKMIVLVWLMDQAWVYDAIIERTANTSLKSFEMYLQYEL